MGKRSRGPGTHRRFVSELPRARLHGGAVREGEAPTARRPKPVSLSGVPKPGLTSYQQSACGHGKHTRRPPEPNAALSSRQPRSRPQGTVGSSRPWPAPSPGSDLPMAPGSAVASISLACSSPAPRATRPLPLCMAARLGCVRPVHVAQGHPVLPDAHWACGRAMRGGVWASHSPRDRQHPVGAGSSGQQMSHRPRRPPLTPAVPLEAGLVQSPAGSVLDLLSGTNHESVKRCVLLMCPQAACLASPLPH